jgi:hypothetical protein
MDRRPFTDDPACGRLIEVGDPLENETNYGGYQHSLSGFTYNLHSAVLKKATG